MKLNTLSLEHQSPKSREKKSKRIMKEEANHQIVADTGVGGKAGEFKSAKRNIWTRRINHLRVLRRTFHATYPRWTYMAALERKRSSS